MPSVYSTSSRYIGKEATKFHRTHTANIRRLTGQENHEMHGKKKTASNLALQHTEGFLSDQLEIEILEKEAAFSCVIRCGMFISLPFITSVDFVKQALPTNFSHIDS